MTEIMLLVGALLLVAACGAFVAAEFSLVTVDRNAVEQAVEDGDGRARGVRSALRTLSTQLSGAQVGITLTNLAIGFMAQPAIAQLLRPLMEGLGLSAEASPGVSLALALVLAAGTTMVFGELVPKNLAIARPLATARVVTGFQRGFTATIAVPIRVLNGTANAFLRRVGVEPQEELASARSAEELRSLVSRSAEQGTLEPETAELIERTLAFGDRTADDVMTPRTRMRTIPGDGTAADVVAASRDSGFSRFPVVGESSDDILGVVHVKQAITVPRERRAATPVSDLMDDATVVPSSAELDDVLATLRGGGMQIAVVADEFGGVDGIVTMEDLVEELVGEVRDEHDRPERLSRRESDGSWIVSGLLRPDEVTEATGFELPTDDDAYDTLGGLVGHELGHVPDEGEVVLLGPDDEHPRQPRLELRVEHMDGLRVARVQITATPEPDEDDGGQETHDRRSDDGDAEAGS